MVKVSVVVITTGKRPKELKECLNSLKKQTYKDFEIVVVKDKVGIPKARNLGIKRSKGKYIAFIDDDAVADKDWLKNLVNKIKYAKVSAVCGRILPFYHSSLAQKVEANYRDLGSKEKFIPWGDTTNIIFRRDVFDLVRFNENLDIGEDVEIGLRLSYINKKILYYPEAKVKHRHVKGFLKYLKHTFRKGYANAKLRVKLSNIEFFAFTELIWIIFGLLLINSLLLHHWIIWLLTAWFGFLTLKSGYWYNSDRSYLNRLLIIPINLLTHSFYIAGKIWYCIKNIKDVREIMGLFRFF